LAGSTTKKVLIRRFDRPDPDRYRYAESLAQAAEAAGYPTPA